MLKVSDESVKVSNVHCKETTTMYEWARDEGCFGEHSMRVVMRSVCSVIASTPAL
jgi:hypothetical protein